MLVNVGVETGRDEPHGGRGVGVTGGEFEPQFVLESLVDGVGRAVDGGDPLEEFVAVRKSGDPFVAGHHQTH